MNKDAHIDVDDDGDVDFAVYSHVSKTSEAVHNTVTSMSGPSDYRCYGLPIIWKISRSDISGVTATAIVVKPSPIMTAICLQDLGLQTSTCSICTRL